MIHRYDASVLYRQEGCQFVSMLRISAEKRSVIAVTQGRVASWPNCFYTLYSGCVVECRICNREVAGSILGLGYFAPRSTQPSIAPWSVNEYQLRLGRQRQVWLIPIADERVGVQVKL